MGDERGGGWEGPLAEFNALRQEVERRSTVRQNVIVLQVTLSGAVASFALSSPRRSGAFVVIPVIGYMLWSVHEGNYRALLRCADYIRTSLSHRVPGGLMWEDWLRSAERGRWRLVDDKAAHAYLVAFPGVSLFACTWAGAYVITDEAIGGAERVILGAAVLADVVLVGVTALSILGIVRLRRDRFESPAMPPTRSVATREVEPSGDGTP